MLYYKEDISDTVCLGIWKIEEAIDYYLSELVHKEWLEFIETTKSDSRIRVMLATRVLLKKLIGEERQIAYLQSGKPYLTDGSWNISISHTKDYVAVAVDKKSNLGLDIEQRTNKVLRVKQRFLASGDRIDKSKEIIHLLLHWSAKEAVFKYLDPSSIDFREHLHVKPFTPQDKGRLEVYESITSENHAFYAHYMVMPEFVLVCIVK